MTAATPTVELAHSTCIEARARRGRAKVALIGSSLVSWAIGTAALGGCLGKRELPTGQCPAELAALRGQLGDARRAVVIRPVADLMERPEPGSALADQALLGDVVSVLPLPDGCVLPSGGMVAIETASRYRGYIAVAALRSWPEPAPPYRSGALWRVVSRFANVYPQPDLTLSNPSTVLPLGVAVRHEREVDGRWVELVLPDGRHGFAHRGDLRREDRPPALAAACVVEQALAHEGSPYLWGGRSTYGIDCSGLVANAYGACGVTVPRDAGQQYSWDAMQPVGSPAAAEIDALRPADLLFFASAEAVPDAGFQAGDRPKITHVGVYLGAGRFIHATTSDRPTVHQSQLSEDGWLRRWVGTRRYPQLLPPTP